jgi:ribosomal protein L11 methyltransferase
MNIGQNHKSPFKATPSNKFKVDLPPPDIGLSKMKTNQKTIDMTLSKNHFVLVQISTKETDPSSMDIIMALVQRKMTVLGFEEESPNTLHIFFHQTDFSEADWNSLLNQLWELDLLDKHSPITLKNIPEENWNETWEKTYYQPICIEQQVYIRASFHPPNHSVPHEIIVDPKMSFGTGHHPTTELMLTEMSNMDFKKKNVIDMGCGSGILAIYAAQKGAGRTVAIDIDDWAVENTKENIALNNISQEITVIKGDERALSEYPFSADVFLANINLGVIVTQVQQYLKAIHSGGKLLLSGILAEDYTAVIEAVQKKETIKKEKNGWLLLVFEC